MNYVWFKIVKVLNEKITEKVGDLFNVDWKPTLLIVPEKFDSMGDLEIPLHSLMRDNDNINVGKLVHALEGEEIPFIKSFNFVNGFLMFSLDINSIASIVLPKVIALKENFGKINFGNGRKIIVEHTSANPLHPLHMGHLRNACIGDTLANLFEFLGFDVERHYYINDLGRQVAILIWGIRKLGWNPPEDVKKDHYVGELYVKANKILKNLSREEREKAEEEIEDLIKKMEDGDLNVVQEFARVVNFCLDGQIETLKRLKIFFDVLTKESWLSHSGLVNAVLKQLSKTKFFKKMGEMKINNNLGGDDEEVKINPDLDVLDLTSFGINKPFILTRTNGTALYATRDIAYSLWKLSRNPEIVFNVIAVEQKLPQKMMRCALKILGIDDADEKIIHYGYELVLLPKKEGGFGKQSSRKGEAVWLDQIIDQTFERALEKIKNRALSSEEKKIVANVVMIAAIKFAMLVQDPLKPILFKIEDALNFKRNSGPYILYTIVRAKSILKKCEGKVDKNVIPNYNCFNTIYEKRILKLIAMFPEIINETFIKRNLSILVRYAIKLADNFNKLYETKSIIKSPEGDREALIQLVKAVEIILTNIMKILGIPILEKM